MQENTNNNPSTNSLLHVDSLDEVIKRAQSRLNGCQKKDGHWAFPLEADVTISAEYILLNQSLLRRN